MPDQKEESVFALTLNWNRPEDTLECLASLKAQENISPEIIVVDNGSTDDSVARIREAHPDIVLIESPDNLRFGGGANLGLRRALDRGADFILLINNDAVLAPGALAKMIAHAREEDVGLVAPLIYYYDDPDRIWSIGGPIRPALLEVDHQFRGEVDPGGWPRVVEQDFVTSCCVLIPRRTLDRIGLYDTDHFIHYYEDADLCYRIRAAGMSIRVAPEAKAWHKVSVSSGGEDAPDERYWMARSSLAYFRKHATGWRWLPILVWRLGSALRTSLRLARKGRWESLRAHWRGLRDGMV